MLLRICIFFSKFCCSLKSKNANKQTRIKVKKKRKLIKRGTLEQQR
jgi:hypothetical protein